MEKMFIMHNANTGCYAKVDQVHVVRAKVDHVSHVSVKVDQVTKMKKSKSKFHFFTKANVYILYAI